jgi:hypothetical protein
LHKVVCQTSWNQHAYVASGDDDAAYTTAKTSALNQCYAAVHDNVGDATSASEIIRYNYCDFSLDCYSNSGASAGPWYACEAITSLVRSDGRIQSDFSFYGGAATLERAQAEVKQSCNLEGGTSCNSLNFDCGDKKAFRKSSASLTSKYNFYKGLYRTAMATSDVKELTRIVNILDRAVKENPVSILLALGHSGAAKCEQAIAAVRENLNRGDVKAAKTQFAQVGEVAKQMGFNL